jgi:microcystin-dependent protein
MPTYVTTVKYALRCLTGANVISDVDAGIQALADDVDGKMATYSQGLLSARPPSTAGTPGIVGRMYGTTDIGLRFTDTGTGWAPDGIPLGGGFDWFGATDPSPELMICDGRAISRTTYATLFAITGTTYGVGNGSTTFNLPNDTDRVLVGAGGTVARGAVGGAAQHQHSHISPVTERNTHVQLVPASADNATFFANASDGKSGRGVSPLTPTTSFTRGWDPDALSGVNNYQYNTSQGSAPCLIIGSNESTMQPYLGAYKVIRVL